MEKVALLIIYNHRYDRNIPILDKLYENTFSHVFHIVPFYDGNERNVIPVYESSYFFQGYISQAYTHLKTKGFTHFFIVADDMILNPKINEHSLWETLGIEKDECCLPAEEFRFLQQKSKKMWPWTGNGLGFKLKRKDVEFANLLPSPQEARRKFDRYGIPYGKVPLSNLLSAKGRGIRFLLKYLPWTRTPQYPLVAAYSDILLVTAEAMPRFTQYCGIFAAAELFVEMAIPTSLVLATDKLKLGKDLKLKYGAMWKGDGKLETLAKQHDMKLQSLLSGYPCDTLFLHPIKLSQWK